MRAGPSSVALLVLLALPCPRGATAQQHRDGPTIALTGDVFPDARVKGFVERRAEVRGLGAAYRELFAEVAPLLRGASLAVVNLETPVSQRYLDDPGPHRPVFNAHPELLDALVGAGVDVLTLANNHAYDQGFDGLRDTMAHAGRRRLTTVGAADDGPSACGPVFRDAAGSTLGLCTWTQGSNRRMPDESEPGGPRIAFIRHGTVERCLGAARRGSDFAVAVFHWSWGDSPWTGPARFEREAARRAAEAGADLVVAHGPHTPGPTERYVTSDGRQVVIIYSLGNLLGSMGDGDRELYSSRLGVRDAPVVVARTRRSEQGRLSLAGLSVTPFWIADPLSSTEWWPDGFQALVRPLSVRRELHRLERSRCGRRCEVRARQYLRRAELTRRAFDLGDEPFATPAAIPPPTLPEPAPSAAAEVAAALPVEAAPPAPALSVPLPEPDPPPLPPPATATAPEPSDLRGRLARGIVLPVRFHRDAMAIEHSDEGAIRQIVELLLEDHGLRVELEGYAAPDEALLPPDTLGRRRALAAKHLIAGAGPSRSRFSISAGEAGGGGRPGRGHVMIRVLPR